MYPCMHDVDGHASIISEYSHIQIRSVFPLSSYVRSSPRLFSLLFSIQSVTLASDHLQHITIPLLATASFGACSCCLIPKLNLLIGHRCILLLRAFTWRWLACLLIP